MHLQPCLIYSIFVFRKNIGKFFPTLLNQNGLVTLYGHIARTCVNTSHKCLQWCELTWNLDLTGWNDFNDSFIHLFNLLYRRQSPKLNSQHYILPRLWSSDISLQIYKSSPPAGFFFQFFSFLSNFSLRSKYVHFRLEERHLRFPWVDRVWGKCRTQQPLILI